MKEIANFSIFTFQMSFLEFEKWEKFFRNSPYKAMMISRALCRANAPDLVQKVAKNVVLLTHLQIQLLNVVFYNDR